MYKSFLHGFVQKITEIFDLKSDLVQPVDHFPQKAKRPDNSSLNTMKIQRMDEYCFRPLKESFEFLKKTKVKN